MGEPLSVTFSVISMKKMENDIAVPTKPIFHRRYVDPYNVEESLFKALRSYHKNTKLTIVISPIKFLIHMLLKYIEKKQKIPAHWPSQTSKKYKRNSIKVDLHRAKKISTNFKEEVKSIRNKFMKAVFSLPFMNSMIKNFINQQERV